MLDMESLNDCQEVPTFGENVQLGWRYNSALKECSSPKVPREYRSENDQKFNYIISHKSDLSKTSPDVSHSSSWFKDYLESPAQEIIRIQMKIINETKACEIIDNSPDQKVVSSLLFKASLDLLIFYDVPVPDSFDSELRIVLDRIFNEQDVHLPTSISNGNRGLNTYDGIKVNTSNNIIWSLREACRQLKDKKMGKPFAVIVSNGNIGKNSLSKDMSVDKDICQLQSKIINENRYKGSSYNTVQNSPSYAQVTSNFAQRCITEIKSDSINNRPLKNSIPVETHLQTSSRDINEELKCQSQISSSKGISHVSQRTPVNGYDGSERLSRPQTCQSSNSNDFQDYTNNSKHVQRERSKSCRRRNSCGRRENQELSTTSERSSSHGRKVSQEVKENNVTYQRSSSRSSSATRRIESVQTALSSGGTSMPRIRNNITPRSSIAHCHVLRDDNTKKSNAPVTVNDQNQNKVVAKHENINQICTDKGSSHDKRENQVFSTTRGRSSSRGRKVSQDKNENDITHQKSTSQSTSGSHRSLNTNSDVSKDENGKIFNIAVAINGQNSNISMPHHENNPSFTDLNSQSKDFHKCQNIDSVSDNKTSNTTADIAINSLNMNEANSSSCHLYKNIAADIQNSYIVSNTDQTSQCGRAFSKNSENSLNNSHSTFKMLEPSKVIMAQCGMKRHYYGQASPNIEEKVILLLGASGSGKTTLVNFIANFFEGVKTPDDGKIIIAPPLEKTKQITAYTFCSAKDTNTAVTIIDTPGLNDSSGSEIRDHVNSLKTFLANTAAHGLKIHALGFVAQAHLVRLTSSERLVMDYVSTLFGEGVKDNIITLISFADVQENPPVVEAMKNYGIKTKHFLKFNNAVLNGSSTEVDDLDRVYWRTGYKSWKKGMKLLNELMPLCINAMKTLQKEVYTKSIVESSVKDLNNELIDFISIYHQGNIDAIRSSSHKIWNLVTIAHHHLRHTPEGSTSIESLLVTSVEKNCQMQSHNSEVYLRALSFYSTRGLDECAQAIILSIQPLYFSVRNMLIAKESKTKSNIQFKKRKRDINSIQVNTDGQILLFCHKCEEDHIMERFDEQRMMDSVKKAVGYKPDAIITFKCNECKCEGSIHGMNPMLSSGEIHDTFGSDLNRLLTHTKDMLANMIRRYSLPKSNITVKDLLQFLMKEANKETIAFINAVLSK